jgi:hypothetical protein
MFAIEGFKDETCYMPTIAEYRGLRAIVFLREQSVKF